MGRNIYKKNIKAECATNMIANSARAVSAKVTNSDRFSGDSYEDPPVPISNTVIINGGSIINFNNYYLLHILFMHRIITILYRSLFNLVNTCVVDIFLIFNNIPKMYQNYCFDYISYHFHYVFTNYLYTSYS